MSCDMRFASTSPSVLISQLETSLGVNPGAGGGMYLARLIGRGLAFEYVLSSADVDARTAARVGWVNAAFDTSRELFRQCGYLSPNLEIISGTRASTWINGVKIRASRLGPST
ncbi:hypothetical protein B0H14DRAFT_2339029 [Mycena olivaceomarginata]|nr:hypothetical protein B0H14DRAFT_2339029 [Mycena olivaceomarginata]